MSSQPAQGKGRALRPTHFNLRGYENLRVEFINHQGNLEYVFRFERRVNDSPQVYFEVVSLSQMFVCDNVAAPMNRKVKTHTAQVTMPKGEAFEVTFMVDDEPRFIVQIAGDTSESAVWFTVFDGAGNELSALCIAKPEAVHLRDFGKGGALA